MLSRIALLLALLLAIPAVGCQGFNPVGPIISLGIYWKNGEAVKYYNTDQRTLVNALKASLQELDIPVNEETERDGTVVIRAGGAVFVGDAGGPLDHKPRTVHLRQEDRFKIKVSAVKPKTTKLSIRVNTFGDRPYAEMVFRHVDAQPGVRQFATLAELNAAAD